MKIKQMIIAAATFITLLVSYFIAASGGGRYKALLDSPEGRQKLTTLARLEESRTIESNIIESLMNDPDGLIRLRCAEALGRIGERECIPYLERLLDDTDDEVVKTALFSLGLTGDEDAVEPISRCLSKRSREIKLQALEALGKTGAPDLAGIITPFLKDFHSSLRAEAALALARLQDSTSAFDCINSLHDSNRHVVACALYALGRLGQKEAAINITPLLEDEDSEVRLRAAEALGRLKEKNAVESLTAMLSDKDRMVAVKSAEALARIGGGESAGALETILTSDDSYLKTVALKGIASTGHKKTLEAILPLLKDESCMVRRAALEATALTGREKAREFLLEAFEKGNITERMTALEFLGEIGLPEDLPLLVRTLSPGNEMLLREGAAAGLGRWKNPEDLTKPVAAGESYHSPADALLDAAGGADWVIATIAIESLEKVGTPEITNDLVRIYNTHNDRVDSDRKLALIDAIASLEKKGQPEQQAAHAVESFLRAAAGESDPRISRLAAESAESMGIKLESRPGGTWKRGAQPWGEPSLPLGEKKILVTTPRGEIEILLFGDDAPNIVKSILTLAEDGFYDGLTFHRVVPGFVIQGGCPRGDGWGDAGYYLRCQFNRHRYTRGAVGMAHAGKDTPGSQFFITHTPQPHLDGRYTVVGTVTRGMQVVDLIETGDSFSIEVIE